MPAKSMCTPVTMTGVKVLQSTWFTVTDRSLTLTTTQVNSNNVAATYLCPLRYVTPAIIVDVTCANKI